MKKNIFWILSMLLLGSLLVAGCQSAAETTVPDEGEGEPAEMEEVTITAELKSHFLRLYQIALSDDNFSHLEMQLLYKFAQDRAISKVELDTILTNYAGDVIIPETLERKIEYLYDFALMIWADEVISKDEEIALKKYIKNFGFLEENIEGLSSYLLESAKIDKPKEDILKELKD